MMRQRGGEPTRESPKQRRKIRGTRSPIAFDYLPQYPSLVVRFAQRKLTMLDLIIIVLIVCWLLGFSIHLGGGLIHLLLVIAVICVLVRLIRGKRI